jgi:hypothetical protein
MYLRPVRPENYDRAPIVSTEQPHSKLIVAAARNVLRPLGVVQKGRSRTWLDDHGWWLGVIEFQPSSYSRGTYLNAGVNWLWNPKGYLSFDYGDRVHFDFGDARGDQYLEYVSDEQFAPLADKLAILAADEVRRYRDLFVTVGATAAVLRNGGRAWLDAAIALGLAGDATTADEMFDLHIGQLEASRGADRRTQADDERYERARLLRELAPDHNAFCAQIRDDTAGARSLLKLDPHVTLPF